MANYEMNTDIKFSSVEAAVKDIRQSRENIEGYLENFADAVRELIANKKFVGAAADTFEEGFDRLKKEKFGTFISLVNEFADVIDAGSKSTEETAKAAEADATTNLYLG
jgi:uncharacterized protein YukE